MYVLEFYFILTFIANRLISVFTVISQKTKIIQKFNFLPKNIAAYVEKRTVIGTRQKFLNFYVDIMETITSALLVSTERCQI